MDFNVTADQSEKKRKGKAGYIFALFSFYGISTIVGHLKPKPVFKYISKHMIEYMISKHIL